MDGFDERHTQKGRKGNIVNKYTQVAGIWALGILELMTLAVNLLT